MTQPFLRAAVTAAALLLSATTATVANAHHVPKTDCTHAAVVDGQGTGWVTFHGEVGNYWDQCDLSPGLARIDVEARLVYCTSSSASSCNLTGASAGTQTAFDVRYLVGNQRTVTGLRGWYSVVTRSTLNHPSYGYADLQNVCGPADPDANPHSCVLQKPPFYVS
ncbi:MAG TPA: hypothetical protein VNA20_13000 [Frankiaceae bacterium]|nr:hypothetical protein [Frankiaceae bacterium]